MGSESVCPIWIVQKWQLDLSKIIIYIHVKDLQICKKYPLSLIESNLRRQKSPDDRVLERLPAVLGIQEEAL